MLSVGATFMEALSTEGLQHGLSAHVVGHLSEQLGKASPVPLCSMVGIALLGQLRAWFTLNGSPQGQCEASLTGVHPYACLVSANWPEEWLQARTMHPFRWPAPHPFVLIWAVWTSVSWL